MVERRGRKPSPHTPPEVLEYRRRLYRDNREHLLERSKINQKRRHGANIDPPPWVQSVSQETKDYRAENILTIVTHFSRYWRDSRVGYLSYYVSRKRSGAR